MAQVEESPEPQPKAGVITRTHNAYHLGDNLVHLNFLRRVALENPDRTFVHYAQWNYLKQLDEVVSDIPNLILAEFNYMLPSDSIDSWRGREGFWYGHDDRNDFVKFHVEHWFPWLADRMKVKNPVQSAADMLFDYPAIRHGLSAQFSCDVLVINSPPGSGQFTSYNEYGLAGLASAISANGFNVVATHELPPNILNVACTAKAGLSVTAIGHLSLHCHTILMVSTGPSWPTFNIWNQESVKHRIILLHPERVELAPNTFHCTSVLEAGEVLRQSGLL